MKNLFTPCTPARLIALAAPLLAFGTVEMFAQAAPASQEVQSLVAEIRELKSRLAAVEEKLVAYQTAPAVPAVKPAADDGFVARLIEGIAIVGIQIKVDCSKGVGQRLRLLPALAVHPGEVTKSEGRGFGGRMFGGGHSQAARCGR